MIFKKCPVCGNKNIYKVTDIETPDMNEEQLKQHQTYMEKKKICYGPKNKKYYCKDCDEYFN